MSDKRNPVFPSDSGSLTVVEVFYRKGDPAFVCGANGAIYGGMVEEIEKDFADNPGDGFEKGDGTYPYVARRVAEQFGEFGRVEIPAHWELEEVGFRPFVAGMGRTKANGGMEGMGWKCSCGRWNSKCLALCEECGKREGEFL